MVLLRVVWDFKSYFRCITEDYEQDVLFQVADPQSGVEPSHPKCGASPQRA